MPAKRFVVIGLGSFGSWVARALFEAGFDVIAVDQNEELVDRFADHVTRCVAGDGTDPEVLEEVGAGGADAAVVSTGTDLAATILAILALQDLDVGEIYAKITDLRAAKALERFDVRELIFPERDEARRLARRMQSTSVLDYIPLGGDYSIQEMAIPPQWVGRSLRELALPDEHGVQIVALVDVLRDEWQVVPDPDIPLTESHVAVIAGSDETLARLTRTMEDG